MSKSNQSNPNSTIIIPKDFCKSRQNFNELSQAKMAGQTRSVIANTNKSFINSFASEILSPLTLHNKDDVARQASCKEKKISNVATTFIPNSIPVSNSLPFQNNTLNTTSKQNILINQIANLPLRDPDYSQSIKRSKIHQSKINPTYPQKSLMDDANLKTSGQISNYQLNTQKGEPTMPGPLGWPKPANSPKSKIIQKDLNPQQPMTHKDTNISSPIFQNITKFGKKSQVNMTTPDQSTNISPDYLDYNKKKKDQQDHKTWSNMNNLSPIGAYSSTAPQITKNFAQTEESSPVIQKVRPESILSRNLYKNYNNTQVPSSLNPSVKLSLKQIVPKNTTSKTSEQNSQNISGQKKVNEAIIYGQTKNYQIKNNNSYISHKNNIQIQSIKNQNQNTSNSYELSSSRLKTNDQILQLSGGTFDQKSKSKTGQHQNTRIQQGRHLERDPEQLNKKQSDLKEFPLSTKNKSMPPFSIQNGTSSTKIDIINRNQQNIVLNPIYQTKKQYYHQMVADDIGNKLLNGIQPIRGINNGKNIEDKDTYRSMKQSVQQNEADKQLNNMLHQTNKSSKQTQLKTIDIESNKQQSLFRTHWNAQLSWESNLVDLSNESIKLNHNKQLLYQDLQGGLTDFTAKKSGVKIFSPQIKKHSIIGTNYRTPIQAEMAVQLQEAYQSPLIQSNLHAKNQNRKNSKIQRILKDPDSDLSQLDRFEKVIQNKHSRNPYDNSIKEKYSRYRIEDSSNCANISHIPTNTNESELILVKNSARSDNKSKKQRQVYQPATVGNQIGSSANNNKQISDSSFGGESKKQQNLLNIEPLHSCLIYLKPSKPFEHRSQQDLHKFNEEPFNLFQLSFLHFSEQFFFTKKPNINEQNFQNVQRAALLVLIVAKAMKAVQLIKLQNSQFIQTDNSIQLNDFRNRLTQYGLELYLIVKQIVGGISNWVLKRIIKPKKFDNSEVTENSSIQDNQWVKKIQQIIKTQYQDQISVIQVVDYTHIINYCAKVQEKLTQIKTYTQDLQKDIQLDITSNTVNQANITNQGQQVILINLEKLQQHLQLMGQVIQQTIIQQQTQKIISIEKFLLIMSKLDQFDQQITLQLSNNIVTSNLPRSLMESSMTTFGLQHHKIHQPKVDRKKNSTPNSFLSLSQLNKFDKDNQNQKIDKNIQQNQNHVQAYNQTLKNQNQKNNSKVTGQLLNQNQPNSTYLNNQPKVHSNTGTQQDQTCFQMTNNLNQTHGNQSFVSSDVMDTSRALNESQQNILVDLNSHQQILRERMKEINRFNDHRNRSHQVDQGAFQSDSNQAYAIGTPDLNRNTIQKNDLAASDILVSGNESYQQSNNGNQHQYALVLDLDETLVHFKDQKFLSDDQKLKIRPGVSQFLEALHPYYTFVVFTAAQKMYADFVISKIDPLGKYIKERFYRNQCKQIGRHQAKDLNLVLNCLNRRIHQQTTKQSNTNSQQGGNQNLSKEDEAGKNMSLFDLNKVIIIDNLSESFQLQPLNGIKIKDWFGNDLADRHLIELIPPLKNIAQNQVHDVRLELSKIRKNQMHSTIGNGPLINAIYANGSSFGSVIGSQYTAFANQRFSHNHLPTTNIKKFSIGYKN